MPRCTLNSDFGLRIAAQATEGSHDGVSQSFAQGPVGCLPGANAVLLGKVFYTDGDIIHVRIAPSFGCFFCDDSQYLFRADQSMR